MKNIIVLYHGECADGFGGAWAAWKKFGSKADYYPIKHDQPMPEGLEGGELYFIDIVPQPKEDTKKWAEKAKRLVILDHHVTAETETKMAHEYRYAVEHSGAGLAWRYFHPDKNVPRLINHIEDADLWRLKLPNTMEVSSYLRLQGFDFKAWDKVAKALEKAKSRKDIIAKGHLLRSADNKNIAWLVGKAALVQFEGYEVYAANSPIWPSEIGHELVKKKGPLAIIWSEKNGLRHVSMRSDGTVDVSKIAAKHGGGGHKAAAAFSVPFDKELPWKLIDGLSR